MKYRAQFPAVGTSALGARRFVSDALGDVPDQASESIILVASELATNAVRHAGSAFEIRIEQLPDRIHIEVEDDGGGQPVVRSPGPYDTSGRGLQIVEELADEWGVIPREGTEGKIVWATIPLRTTHDHLVQARHDETGRDSPTLRSVIRVPTPGPPPCESNCGQHTTFLRCRWKAPSGTRWLNRSARDQRSGGCAGR